MKKSTIIAILSCLFVSSFAFGGNEKAPPDVGKHKKVKNDILNFNDAGPFTIKKTTLGTEEFTTYEVLSFSNFAKQTAVMTQLFTAKVACTDYGCCNASEKTYKNKRHFRARNYKNNLRIYSCN